MSALHPRRALAASVLLGIIALPACTGIPLAASTPQLDASFGESVRQVRAVQTVDPQAGRKAGPVAGIDGDVGRSVIDEYQKSFKEPPTTFNILGIGGSAVGGR